MKHWLAENRIYLVLIAIFALMASLAPNFLTWNNQTSIMKGMSLQALPAIGFTIVMITRQLDLSIGSVLTLGGMLTVGLQPQLGWGGSIAVAVAAGCAVGYLNGFLVTKAKVDSFIATLGTMIIVQGFVYQYSGGDTLVVENFALGDWMESSFLPLLSPRILLVILIVLVFEAFLKKTSMGRAFYLVGGNATTAWHAGIPVDRYVTSAFVISGGLSALGGALFSISINSATTTMGVTSLMVVVAAVIIGGTSMNGGKGSVFKSMIALIALTMLANGFSAMGAGWEIQKITGGLVLASVILYDAWVQYRKEQVKGQRHELLEQLEILEDTTMQKKNDNTLAIVCVSAVACVAIVAIFAMFNLRLAKNSAATMVAMPAHTNVPASPATANGQSNLEWSLAIDASDLTSVDGQLLIPPSSPKTIPERPANPEALEEHDAGYWYDMEYAGWGLDKINIPQSPADGTRGKKVAFLKMVDHPYQTANERGMQKIADMYGIEMKTMVANADINTQAQQVDQVINEGADLVIINPVDAKACLPLFRKLNQAGIPIIASNVLPSDEAMAYTLAWTGPDDWGQMRMLARDFAELMNYEGGYCIVRHRPGSSPYFARTFAIITELKKIAPKMELLAMQTTDLEAEKSMQVVSDWITRFGPELKGIVSCDDSGAQVGINEAVANADREDIIRVAAGNSKVGMEFIQYGSLKAITFQSPEADGAIPMQLAADWFNGKPVDAVRYLPQRIITIENVEEFLPAQW
ncbi:substrate-binding domain-containing protein [Rubellicoccus peritrichatus]|uniref:Substrate-binding domain-containing protein n=1 Tax=Rubellicoccus peritrichatus TaxID=3080537 RepID=A0AAQ3L925_9BACT|nr:substrate-binding domain-containing protein [Puniceicoccus sp. CR14]WOO39535.1 substrate-binding domain-containing protein [Puniceicoccus sp. CR14]